LSLHIICVCQKTSMQLSSISSIFPRIYNVVDLGVENWSNGFFSRGFRVSVDFSQFHLPWFHNQETEFSQTLGNFLVTHIPSLPTHDAQLFRRSHHCCRCCYFLGPMCCYSLDWPESHRHRGDFHCDGYQFSVCRNSSSRIA
jgi:hypothetical protein